MTRRRALVLAWVLWTVALFAAPVAHLVRAVTTGGAVAFGFEFNDPYGLGRSLSTETLFLIVLFLAYLPVMLFTAWWWRARRRARPQPGSPTPLP